MGNGAVSSSAVGTAAGARVGSLGWQKGSGRGVARGWVMDGAWGDMSWFKSLVRTSSAISPDVGDCVGVVFDVGASFVSSGRGEKELP